MDNNKKISRYLSNIVFLIIVSVLLFMGLKMPVNAATIVHNGDVGGLTWSIDSDGKLSVYGKGDYFSEETWTPSWCEYNDEIIRAEVGIDGITSTANMFSGCSNMISVDLSKLDTSYVTDMSFMFNGCSSLKSVDISGFDISNVSNMGFMFDGCSGLEALDISGLKFYKDNYYYMDTMLYGCSGLKTFTVPADLPEDISLPGATVMYDKASETYTEESNYYWIDTNGNECTVAAKNLSTAMTYSRIEKTSTEAGDSTGKKEETTETQKQEDNKSTTPESGESTDKKEETTETQKQEAAITNNDPNILYSGVDGALTWSIDKNGQLLVTGSGDYKGNFPEWVGSRRWKSITSAVIKVDKITNTSNMFSGCENMLSIDVSGLNTSDVTSMSNMFYGCKKLTTIDVSKFSTYNVTNMSEMFCYCSGITDINVSNFSTTSVINFYRMFSGCTSLKRLDLRSFYFGVESSIDMLYGCSSLESVKLPELWDVTFSLPENKNYVWKNSKGYECTEPRRFTLSDFTYKRYKKKTIKNGFKYEDVSGMYKVLNTSKRTVEYLGASYKYYTTVLIDDVSIRGKTYKVQKISSKAMKKNDSVALLSIGDNVEIIGDSAFEGCNSLEAVIIGKKVKKIGGKAFYNCNKLEDILIRSTNLKRVGNKAFKKINKKYKLHSDKKSKKFKSKYRKLFKGKIGA